MRILFLSHYFPPEVNAPASRTYEHCRQWVKDGHHVTVVTCAPNHPGGKVYPGYKNKLYGVEEKDGIRVVRLWTYIAANEGFLKRTLGYISYMVSVILMTPFFGKHDVVVSTSPQFFNGLAGYFVSRMRRVPWVLEIRDLWPESILAVGAITNKKVIKALESIETFAYKKADAIVSVTDAFTKHIAGRGVAPEKIEVIKNGVDLKLFVAVRDPAEAKRELGLDGKFVASYVGTHGMAHGLEVVLKTAEQLSERKDIVFLLVGDGAEKQKLKQLKEKKGLENVIMLDQQPKQRMPTIWGASDVSMVLLRKQELFKTVIPSKIFESMAMERPIVLGVQGESQALIEEAAAGICIEPENVDELAAAICRLCQDDEAYREMARSGRQFVQEHFDRAKLAQRYLKLLEETCNRRALSPRGGTVRGMS